MSAAGADAGRRAADGEVASALRAIRRAASELERRRSDDIDAVAAADRPSARNLVHYVAFRQFDLRDLQPRLARRGLSSLGRAESHVLATIDAVLGHLDAPAPTRAERDQPASPTVDEGLDLLDRHATDALGPHPTGRARLMVTLPSAAATDDTVTDRLVEAGMDIARINAAHDGPEAWRAMADRVARAAANHGRAVRLACDLPGPKLRTGPLPDGPPVVRVRPRRTVDGHVQRPATVRFVDPALVATAGAPPPDHVTVVVPVEGGLLDGAAVGDTIRMRDTRGRRRRFVIASAWPGVVEATSDRTSYIGSGRPLERHRHGDRAATGRIGPLPRTSTFLRLQRGDRLRIVTGSSTGRPATLDDRGQVVDPATISCEVPDVARAVDVGHRVLLDDGTIETVVTEVNDAAGWFETRVVRPDEAKLRAEKGINLPDSDLTIDALTDADVEILETVAAFTDLVSLSFVSTTDDLDRVRAELDRLGRPDVAVVMKIEHAAAFRALPRLLLHGLRRPPIAVMVARGDLAVEVGFERLAEVQEQIMWLCEAAHVPVIWATQVLESLAKEGVPTRAEVTDAARAGRAECVMLNKGPYVVEAMRFLSDVSDRMGAHQRKRTPMLRRLSVSTELGDVSD